MTASTEARRTIGLSNRRGQLVTAEEKMEGLREEV